MEQVFFKQLEKIKVEPIKIYALISVRLVQRCGGSEHWMTGYCWHPCMAAFSGFDIEPAGT